jgi:hypothetical protein
MLEFILLFIFFYLVINSFSRRKARRKPRTLDAELRALIQDHNTNTGIALDIKRYLLDIINDNNNDLEKFSDSRINQAQHLLDRSPVSKALCRSNQWNPNQCECRTARWSNSGSHNRHRRQKLISTKPPKVKR